MNPFKVGDKVRVLPGQGLSGFAGSPVDGQEASVSHVSGPYVYLDEDLERSWSHSRFELISAPKDQDQFLVLGYLPTDLVKGREAAEAQAKKLLETYGWEHAIVLKAVTKVERVSTISVSDFA